MVLNPKLFWFPLTFNIENLLNPKTLVRIVLPKIKFDLNISRPIFVYKNFLLLFLVVTNQLDVMTRLQWCRSSAFFLLLLLQLSILLPGKTATKWLLLNYSWSLTLCVKCYPGYGQWCGSRTDTEVMTWAFLG